MEKNDIFYGSDIPLTLYVETIEGHTLRDYEWYVVLYSNPTKSFKMQKSEAKETDSPNHYILPVPTTELGPGVIEADVYLEIPDPRFKDGIRHDRRHVLTMIPILK